MQQKWLARDSVLWVFGIITGLLTFLYAAPAPTEWGYHDWLKFIGVAIVTISAKLSNSPSPSIKDIEWTAVNRDRRE